MDNLDELENGSSLAKIQKLCKVLKIIMKIVFAVLLVCWLFVTGSMLLSFTNSGLVEQESSISILNLVLCVAYGVIIGVMFFAFVGMFSDVSRGSSPFTLKQVGRLRLIAAMLVMYALLDFAIEYNSMLFQISALNSGYISAGGSAIVTVNFAPLIAAAVVFAFSFVFKYGVLLQEFSDDVI